MITVKISTKQELEQAWRTLRKLESGNYEYIKNNLPRFIYIHGNSRVRSYTWTHGMHSNYYNYPLLDISALYNLEKTNPELFI